MKCNPAPRPNRRPSIYRPTHVALMVCCASVPLAMVQSASALTLEPSIQLAQTLSNNINLSPSAPRSDAVTRVIAGISAASGAGALRGFLNFSVSGLYSVRDSDRNALPSQNRLAGNVDLELFDGHGFMNISATVAQTAKSAFGAQVGNDGLASDNTTEVRSLRIAPRWQGRFGGDFQYSLTGVHQVSNTKGSNLGDASSNTVSASVANRGVSRLGWSLEASREISEYKSGRTTSTSRFLGATTLRVDEIDMQFGASAGREFSNLGSLEPLGRNIWGASAAWTPSPRTRLSSQIDKRSVGHTYQTAFEYRTALSVWQISESRTVSIAGNQLRSGNRGTIFDLFFEQFAAVERDPVRRVDLVNAYLRANGIDPDANSAGFLTSAATLRDQLSISMAYKLPRGAATVIASHSTSRRADTLSAAVDDLTSAGQVAQNSIAVNLAHRLSPSLSSNLGFAWQKSDGASTNQSNHQRAVNLHFGGPLTARSTWSFGLRRTLFETTSLPYNESAVVASFTLQL